MTSKRSLEMIRKKGSSQGMLIIDCTGPAGNAYSLLSQATKLAGQLRINKQKVRTEMMSGDYENLISVFDKYFGNYVILER